MDKNFLLTTDLAKRLFFEVAKDLPIIDYHNHLSAQDILMNKKFTDITQLWLAADPYKHRLMRICGVPEHYITGTAGSFEKFQKFCEIFPGLVGTPVYDWSIMELTQIFGITETPSLDTAKVIWEKANALLQTDSFSAQGLLNRFPIAHNAPCVSILDDVSGFSAVKNLCPSLRGDDMVSPTREFIQKLGACTNVQIHNLNSYIDAIKKQIALLDAAGCRFSDHALDAGFTYQSDDGKNAARFSTLLAGSLNEADSKALSCEILRRLGKIYYDYKWNVQLHIGALRRTSDRLRSLAGAAGGYAGIGNSLCIASVVSFINDLEKQNTLPKIILFNLNPADNAMLSVLSGSFSKDNTPALISQGPAWWWCDHIQGMKQMLDNFSAYSVLSTFIGMTTDSRSILSLVRHEYFRRVLCMWIGENAQKGIFPADFNLWKPIVEKICYGNANAAISRR